MPVAKGVGHGTIIRESREGSIARHLDCKLATGGSASPQLTRAGELTEGLTTRGIDPGEAGFGCTKPIILSKGWVAIE